MPWEWRVFYPITGDCVDIVGREKYDSSAVKRTDEYLCIAEDVGVKIRGKKHLECKNRVLLSMEGMGKWEKTRMRSNISADDDKIAAEILGMDIVDDDEIDKVRLQKRFCRIAIQKKRVRFYTKSGALCEQTDIQVISISDGFPGSKKSTALVWRTVCVEGKKKDVISGIEDLKHILSSQKSFLVMGYPKFCMMLAFSKKE